LTIIYEVYTKSINSEGKNIFGKQNKTKIKTTTENNKIE